jgi:hypothetical protein
LDRELPILGVGRDVVGRQLVEGPSARQVVAVVAFDAVFLDDGPLPLGSGLFPPIGRTADRGGGAYERYRYDDLG